MFSYGKYPTEFLCIDCLVPINHKQWPLAPNLREWQITRANVARRVTFFSKTAVGECWRVWRVLAKRLGECGEFGESRVFLKTAVLASTRTRQKRRVSREYSNSLNSPASSHCLTKI